MSEFLSCNSLTNKSTSNQDFCAIIHNNLIGFRGVIVADGIGSHTRSELSAQYCVEKLKEKLENIRDKSELNFKKFYFDIKEGLKQYADLILSEPELLNNPFGTTLICAISLEDEYIIAYIGNGSIWHISGNFNHFSENRYLPWNSNNLLVPHTIEKDGKSALVKFISIDDNVSSIPSIIKLSKNEDYYGDIIILTTDGVFTNDESRIGKDDNGTVWIMGEDSIIALYKSLNIFFKETEQFDENSLQLNLSSYLNELKNNNLMHDDTTLGIIISPRVIEYQKGK